MITNTLFEIRVDGKYFFNVLRSCHILKLLILMAFI